ncbi:hypothetical protein [Mesorhizobium sp. WSM3868]|uniref:ATP-dependent DNA ligase n=1 Tax=Mesorhizobium sp. WSM3868 TaxID=2029405 RepID=UPI000BD912BD|nr:hypothetical protein [Mesorhizobium sp. WSM3868]PBB32457.1 hypothetical protein CK221_25030 [Mesorhizobium sp. WSM3868]
MDWLHEIKYDGYRTQVILDGAGERAFSRNLHDWSQRYSPIIAAAEKLPKAAGTGRRAGARLVRWRWARQYARP